MNYISSLWGSGVANVTLSTQINEAANNRHNSLSSRTWQVAKVVFNCIALAFFMWANVRIAFVGFLYGLIDNESVKSCINKISHAWQTRGGWSAAAFVIVAYMNLPLTIGAGSFLSWASLGAHWSGTTSEGAAG